MATITPDRTKRLPLCSFLTALMATEGVRPLWQIIPKTIPLHIGCGLALCYPQDRTSARNDKRNWLGRKTDNPQSIRLYFTLNPVAYLPQRFGFPPYRAKFVSQQIYRHILIERRRKHSTTTAKRQPSHFFFHLAVAAMLAISDLCSGLNDLALAFAPFAFAD